MRLNLIILIFLSLQIMIGSNAQWTIKHLDETLFTYDNVIKFKNDTFGLFMGSNSVILKSNDAGDTWNQINLETQINIKDFQFIDDTIIYAVGDYYTGVGENLTSILIRSSDNGDTWDSLINFAHKQLYSLWFFNNDSGMVSGFDGIYRTVDAGQNWDTVWSIIQFGYRYGSLEQIFFSTSQIGYAIGEARTQNNTEDLVDHFILKTINSGITWDTIETFPSILTSLYFINQDTGFIGTETSTVLKTLDGGDTWSEIQITNYYNSISSIHFISNMNGFATGSPYATIPEEPTSFFISKTIDGGLTWESYDTIGIPLNSIYFLNDTVGFVSGLFCLIMKSNVIIKGLPDNYPWYLVGNVSVEGGDIYNSLIKVYPNPTNGILFLKINDAIGSIQTIKIMDTTGKVYKIIEPIIDNEFIHLDISDIESGIYFIQVFFSDKIESLKVFKK
jgi:photosystem II stability/assembly factor-like uncharacterized protein